MEKQAIKDAVETLERNWQALFTDLKPLIMRNDTLSEEQKHYCFWALNSYDRLDVIVSRRYPVAEFELSWTELRRAGNYLNRAIGSIRAGFPVSEEPAASALMPICTVRRSVYIHYDA